MIVVDASALVSMLIPEADGLSLAARLSSSHPSQRFASTISLWEAASAVARLKACDRRLGLRFVEEFALATDIQPISPDLSITKLAVEAAERYGMGGGRPGILNLGDCFSYATARHLGASLLFKGNDFSATDIVAA